MRLFRADARSDAVQSSVFFLLITCGFHIWASHPTPTPIYCTSAKTTVYCFFIISVKMTEMKILIIFSTQEIMHGCQSHFQVWEAAHALHLPAVHARWWDSAQTVYGSNHVRMLWCEVFFIIYLGTLLPSHVCVLCSPVFGLYLVYFLDVAFALFLFIQYCVTAVPVITTSLDIASCTSV